MRPLIIDCSPRVGGNSDIITRYIDEHFEVDKVYLRDKHYSLCNGCAICNEVPECVNHDDATILYEDILTRDVVIFVAPVYFYSFDAHTKAFIDRAQYLWSLEREAHRTRRMYLIAVGGQDFSDNFTPMERTITCLAYTCNAKYMGGLFFTRVDKAGDIDTPENMTRIKEFVENI